MAFYVWLLLTLAAFGLLTRYEIRFIRVARVTINRQERREALAGAIFFGLVLLAGAIALIMLPLPPT